MKQVYLITAILCLLFSGCSKEDPQPAETTGRVTFWTQQSGNWDLILDGVEYGKLKKATQMPVCGDEAFQNFTLSAGQHTADAKSLDGFAWGNPLTFTVTAGDCIQVKLPQ